jgi:bifunctional DNase/RNase
MAKIRVDVDEILLGANNATYQLILKELEGKRRMPIVIGMPEAQSIALALENRSLKRPNTHEFFVATLSFYSLIVREVNIVRLEDGVFFSLIAIDKEGKIDFFDSRTSDAIAIALRCSAPIFVEEIVMQEAGIPLDEDETFDQPGRVEEETIFAPRSKSFQEELEEMNVIELEKMLKEAIKFEDYAKAALLRDELAKRK